MDTIKKFAKKANSPFTPALNYLDTPDLDRTQLPESDGTLIAAIARAQNTVLANRNIADFCDCQLILVNPWQGDR